MACVAQIDGKGEEEDEESLKKGLRNVACLLVLSLRHVT
jgi:hypothetical protein